MSKDVRVIYKINTGVRAQAHHYSWNMMDLNTTIMKLQLPGKTVVFGYYFDQRVGGGQADRIYLDYMPFGLRIDALLTITRL